MIGWGIWIYSDAKNSWKKSYGHPLKNQKFLQSNDFSCIACSQRKVDNETINRKIRNESISFLDKKIQCDICGPIHPLCWSFRYFIVLIDASTRWSHIFLLSTCNHIFTKLLAQLIKLKTHYPDYLIKKIRLDNAGEFKSHIFHEYCISIGIEVEHLVAYFVCTCNLSAWIWCS